MDWTVQISIRLRRDRVQGERGHQTHSLFVNISSSLFRSHRAVSARPVRHSVADRCRICRGGLRREAVPTGSVPDLLQRPGLPTKLDLLDKASGIVVRLLELLDGPSSAVGDLRVRLGPLTARTGLHPENRDQGHADLEPWGRPVQFTPDYRLQAVDRL